MKISTQCLRIQSKHCEKQYKLTIGLKELNRIFVTNVKKIAEKRKETLN